MKTALLLVDVQRDFMPGGSLPVAEGDRIIPVINRLVKRYPLVAVTQDWHPPGHLSFASSHPGREPMEEIELDGLPQILWPDHCIQGSEGAGFPDELDLRPAAAIFRKGMDPGIDSYSGFFDNDRRHHTGLGDWLRSMKVGEVHVAGLAAEVCVAYTARHAVELGFRAAIVEDATRALSAEDYGEKKRELTEKGVRFLVSDEIESASGQRKTYRFADVC